MAGAGFVCEDGTMAQESTIVILTGAGISAESGLPTFRDANGLWHGHRVEEVATPEAFAALVEYWNDLKPLDEAGST